MDDASKRLLEGRLAAMSDDDLLRMVSDDVDEYTDEALDMAEGEIRRRGLELPYASDAPLDAARDADGVPAAAAGEDRERLRYEIIRGSLASWDQLCEAAARFASRIGRDRVLSVSHSEDGSEAIVTVWYWE